MSGPTFDLLTALVAGTLLCAGAAKLVVPVHATRALHGLVPGIAQSGTWPARGVAVVELVTAAALSFTGTRRLGLGAAVVLGAGFALVGVLGLWRRVGAPCGCFGSGTGRPIGPVNVAVGAGLAVLAGVLLGAPTDSWSPYTELPALGAAATAVLLVAWLNRRMIADLAPPIAFLTRRGPETRRTG